MADPQKKSALHDQYMIGAFGGDGRYGAGVFFHERRPSALVQIHGVPEEIRLVKLLDRFGLQPPPAPLHCSQSLEMRLLWNGPYMWLAESEEMGPAALQALLRKALPNADTTFVDLTHARTVLQISGPAVRDLLSKGCPLDVESMQPSECASSHLGHFNIMLNCLQDGFDIYVFRSFGRSLWQWLLREAEEFGYQIL